MSMTAEQLQYQQRSVRQYQEYFDNALRTIGERAPEHVLGHSSDRYFRRTLIDMKKELPDGHPLKQVIINGDLRDDALHALTPQFIEAYIAERRCPSDLAYGEIRPHEVKDPLTGHVKWIEFKGLDNFVKFMGRPGRRVVKFRTSDGAPGWW